MTPKTPFDSKTRSGIGQKLPAKSRHPKSHEDYWKPRLKRRSYRASDGTTREVPELQVKLFKDGKQRWINLETANRDEAAKKARDHWKKLQVTGWEGVKPSREAIINPTIGEFLAAVHAESDLKPATFADYSRKLRTLVAGVYGIRADNAKHDRFNGGHARWLNRVNSVRFSRLTPRAVQKWKTEYIAAAGGNPLLDRKARTTIASVIRSVKALFSRGVTQKLHMNLPNPMPLTDVETPRVRVQQYVSKIDSELLIQKAKRELKDPTEEALRSAVETSLKQCEERRQNRRKRTESAGKAVRVWRLSPDKRKERVSADIATERNDRREMYRIFLLGILAGLRRDEIDTLTWGQIDFKNGKISIETNEFTSAKSDGSETTVDIDVGFSGLLREWMQGSTSKFVIASNVEPRPHVASYHHYRCNRLFDKLGNWLRAHGMEGERPLHTLRKEFGTYINSVHGLFAASDALRHSSIQLTRSVYVAKKVRAVYPFPSTIPQQENYGAYMG